jgi:hypothetical protein
MVAILQDALEERQVLLQEVHHRVKNNFQTIISLLELQAAHLEQPGFDRLLYDIASRIRAMALIHEQLYQQSDFSHVLLDELCASLVAHMQQVTAGAIRPGGGAAGAHSPAAQPGRARGAHRSRTAAECIQARRGCQGAPHCRSVPAHGRCGHHRGH